MLLKILLPCLLVWVSIGGIAEAHFGMLIPSKAMVVAPNEANVRVDIGFAHPSTAVGLPMEKPAELFIWDGIQKTSLGCTETSWLGEAAWQAEFRIARPGTYILGVAPQPYYEAAEQRYIIHYTKTIIGAFGYEEDFDRPAGFPIEIIPLTRPFGNYAGNTFTGLVLYKGKPLAGASVEVEFLNQANSYKAPNPYFETQLVKTDINGVFSFGIPWPGWWGFAALTTGDEKMAHEGTEVEVELGGVLWVQFAALPGRE